MSYDVTSNNAMTLEEFGNKFINDDIRSIVDANPYLAFFVLSAAIEFITRCRLCETDFHSKVETAKRFVETIDEIEAFRPYRIFKYKCGKGYTNKLYTALRCGLLHAGMPNSGIVLSAGNNELDRNVVGCQNLYNDVKRAWEEIKANRTIKSYLESNKGLEISESMPSNK